MQTYRYKTLDAWRAVAALAVVLFHCTNTVLQPEMGWWARTLLSGWAGVFVFFPISGYCIFAAVSRAENATVGQFLRRRWRRIVPPYWASLALVIVVAYAAAPFNGGLTGYLNLGIGRWTAVLTLTQGFAGVPEALNPVYWSLCYEEQFYFVLALMLLVASRCRRPLLLAITVAAAIYRSTAWPAGLRLPGVFLEHWLEFALGLAVFVWLKQPDGRAWAAAIVAIVTASAAASPDLGIAISLVAAALFIVLAPFDEHIATTQAGAALVAAGAMSYSLYLVHVPIGGRAVNLFRRFDLPLLTGSLAGILVSIGGGWLFYRTVERYFVNPAGHTQTLQRELSATAPAA